MCGNERGFLILIERSGYLMSRGIVVREGADKGGGEKGVVREGTGDALFQVWKTGMEEIY